MSAREQEDNEIEAYFKTLPSHAANIMKSRLTDGKLSRVTLLQRSRQSNVSGEETSPAPPVVAVAMVAETPDNKDTGKLSTKQRNPRKRVARAEPSSTGRTMEMTPSEAALAEHVSKRVAYARVELSDKARSALAANAGRLAVAKKRLEENGAGELQPMWKNYMSNAMKVQNFEVGYSLTQTPRQLIATHDQYRGVQTETIPEHDESSSSTCVLVYRSLSHPVGASSGNSIDSTIGRTPLVGMRYY